MPDNIIKLIYNWKT